MEDDFSDDQKLSCLLDSLRDSTTASIVRQSLSNGDSFSKVEELLHSKFDLPREVFLQALNSLIKVGQLDYDAQCLSVATSELRKSYNTLMM